MRSVPSDGQSSGRVGSSSASPARLQEALQRCRELHSAADFAAAASAVANLSQTLPQVVHHRAEITEQLLSRITPQVRRELSPGVLIAVLRSISTRIARTPACSCDECAIVFGSQEC